jgi:hypothetical protein
VPEGGRADILHPVKVTSTRFRVTAESTLTKGSREHSMATWRQHDKGMRCVIIRKKN